MSLIPNQYKESVISIGVRVGTQINWIGTGFFIIKMIDQNKGQPFMVTNKHVIENKDQIVIRLQEQDTGALRVLDVPLIENGLPMYSVYDDPNVDIAVILLNGGFIMENKLKFSAFDIDRNVINSSGLLQRGGDEGSSVFMLGFPLGLVNVESNSPICRGGYIARIDESEINNTKQFLLDMQNFPGNSGSPVISKPEILSIGGSSTLGECLLIGIVRGYIPYEEQLVNAQTGRVVEVRSENSGIAVVHPVELIIDVMEKEMRRNNILITVKETESYDEINELD